MKPVSFIICAAGRGERFRKAGLDISKPKIILDGISMLERSLASLNLQSTDQLIIIGQEEDDLKSHFPKLKNASWINLKGLTKGQLDTFLSAKDIIEHEDIVIFNCDTFFSSSILRSSIDSGKYSGIIPCSKEPGLSWSFCKVDPYNNILEVAEKKRISDWASVGYYYFNGKKRLLDLAVEEIQFSQASEVYVAPLYNRYIELGLPLLMIPTKTFLPFGTLEQVADYWRISAEALLAQNS